MYVSRGPILPETQCVGGWSTSGPVPISGGRRLSKDREWVQRRRTKLHDRVVRGDFGSLSLTFRKGRVQLFRSDRENETEGKVKMSKVKPRKGGVLLSLVGRSVTKYVTGTLSSGTLTKVL